MLKVALIEPVGGHGGMDFYDYGLAQGLGLNGVEVFYFTSTQTQLRDYANVKTFRCFKNVWNVTNKFKRLYFFLLGYLKAFQTAKKEKINIVHLQFFDLGILNVMVMLLLSRFNFQKVLTLHDVSSFKGENSSFTEKFILARFDKFIVHNKLSHRELINKLPEKKPVTIIPHGNYLPFIEELPYTGTEVSGLNLLFFGQIKKVKGLDVLLKALAIAVRSNTGIRLVIAGKPWHDELSYYQNLIEDLDLKNFVTTHFKYIPNEEVASYFKACDAVVLPYRKIYQSGVLLLAMSYGRVAVCSDLESFKEVVSDGESGYLFRRQNPKDLSNVFLKMAMDKQVLTKVREKASYKLKQQFDWVKIGLKTRKFYQI